MQLKKKLLIALVALSLVISVPVTYAWLVKASNSVSNIFTVGDIRITLRETTGDTYYLTPGVTLEKDPVVTVHGGSEACWLFVRMEADPALNQLLTYQLADGWHALGGHSGVYYRMVDLNAANQSFHILLQDQVTVNDFVTEEMLSTLAGHPTITFSAYAIQQEQVDSASQAWQLLMAAQEG